MITNMHFILFLEPLDVRTIKNFYYSTCTSPFLQTCNDIGPC